MLKLQDLSVFVQANGAEKQVVSNVSFTVPEGKITGIVGESGSGKTMLCNAVMQLFRESRRYTGHVFFQGKPLLEQSEQAMRRLRGKEIALIMQNPMAVFNPIVTISDHFVETLQSHERLSKKQARKKAAEQLARFQLPDEALLDRYPHELSGGMLQRIMIALAACLQPSLLIADEPTTALDTMTQLDILNELLEFQQSTKTSMLIVSHDLGVIAKMADTIVVMRQGEMVEYGRARVLLTNPAHSYTRALLAARNEQTDLDDLVDTWDGTVAGPLYEYQPGCWARQEE